MKAIILSGPMGAGKATAGKPGMAADKILLYHNKGEKTPPPQTVDKTGREGE